ncbi:RNA polymerase sigma factor [Thermosporothrix hazakensis]|nr:RNA polymerase sigma factor [Thermosporothrix hazakensis]
MDIYTELYQLHAPALFAYLLKRLQSRDDAEDVLYEAFLAALEHPHFSKLDVQRQRAWLWRVAQNKMIDQHRRNSRHPKVALGAIGDSLFEDENDGPEYQLLKQEEYAFLHSSLEKLPSVQQEVLRLRFGHSLSCEEIAKILGKSSGAIRMILTRTMKNLRSIYKRTRGDKMYDA